MAQAYRFPKMDNLKMPVPSARFQFWGQGVLYRRCNETAMVLAFK
jgi:hypothetical protein